MCGIVGIWNFNYQPLKRLTLDHLTDSLSHRGPDGRGVFIDERVNLGLGHRRLAILNPSSLGHQPMSYGGRRYWITYNGEIYNFIELREELEKYGHSFETETDTEVVLAAYAQWGQDCQLKFNGMWAFAIWDTVDRVLFLSRDRFGVKPLFFLETKGCFVFASELKAFMALPNKLRPEFDFGMIARMKNEESVEKTLLKGVKNLGGGCCFTIENGGTPRVRRWWETKDHLRTVPADFGAQASEYKELLYDACRIRMRSDVSIGTALSGGLDSSSVLCAMADVRGNSGDQHRLATDWQKAFILVYMDSVYDEKKFAEQVISKTGVTPMFVELKPDFISIDDLRNAVFGFEAIQNAEPSLGPWLLYQEMRRSGVVVSLDGHGGDEALAGYHSYIPVAMKDAVWPKPNPERWRDLQSIATDLYEDELPEGMNLQRLTPFDVVASIFPNFTGGRNALRRILKRNPWVFDRILRSYRAVKGAAGRHGGSRQPWLLIEPADPSPMFGDKGHQDWSYLKRALYWDFHYGTNPRILRNFDRMSMSHGIESRAPLMDWRLVCYSFSLPDSSILGAGVTKRILREAMQGVLPDQIRLRKSKLGFSSPMRTWYQHGLKDQVLDEMNRRQFLESAIWNGPEIRRFTEDCYRRNDYNNAVKSWKFIQAMLFLDAFKECGSNADKVL